MSVRSDCRKFAPNIFNKSKCTNCFRQKEEHSAEALESNRASRKISKCGYLFVAPGWDFSNPLYRTKRWQRRWFVLYDDGDLTYSLDEHPDTVPQASVDMNTVVEVSAADEVTGHAHSLAVATPERVTFVRAACREEARWWADVLSVFPRTKGRHKRNATFPGGQPASLLQTTTTVRNGLGAGARPRYNSCHAGAVGWTPSQPPAPRPQPPQPEIATRDLTQETKVYTDQPVSSASPPTRDKINGEEKARARRRDTAPDVPAHAAAVPCASDPSSASDHQSVGMRHYDEQLRDIAASLTRPRSRRSAPAAPTERPTRDAAPEASDTDHDQLDADICHKLIQQVRGSPDGGAPTTANGEENRGGPADDAVELPAERLLHARAGWLRRRGTSGWSRHWFVLRGGALLYFRDPQAEHRGIMDGVIDLSGVARVRDLAPPAVAPGAGFAFETRTWDDRHYVLAAVTAGIRSNWVSAIRRTAGLPELPPSRPDSFPPGKELILSREDSMDTSECSSAPVTPITPQTPRSNAFSSDDEYRTASEGGRRDSTDWGDSVCQLPPSPVLARTPISRVKDKVRARGYGNPPPPPVPPNTDVALGDADEVDTSEKTMVEIVSPFPCIDDMVDNEITIKPFKRSYISTIDKQSIEIEDLRKQLKLALGDMSTAEKELNRLRKVKSESVLREKKMEELLMTLQKTEEELLSRTKEAENLDTIKQLYSQDKNLWECKLTETQNFLRESTEHCALLTRQLNSGQETIEHLQRELTELSDKLHRSVKENDGLYTQIRNLEGRTINVSPTKEKRKSIGSLSELTNINLDVNADAMDKSVLIEEYAELRTRFLKAIQEIKVMKKELRESHSLYDELELANMSLRSEMKLREECSKSEINMMADRIQDLTQKLTASDKQVRALKHKLQKSESREKRRSLSLKGRESFSIGKEVEEKLTELENKLTLLETGNVDNQPVINPPSKGTSPAKEKPSKRDEVVTDEKRLKRIAARLRRKSLDSATSSEPMKMLVRLSSLETKVSSALEGRKELTISCESLINSRSIESPSLDSPNSSSSGSQKHLLDRLQSLENVVILSRNKVNECLCQMSALRASKSRRSPSPSMDKKYSIRSIEKCLGDVSKTLQDCFDKCVVECEHGEEQDASDPVLNVVVQLEEQLTNKLLEISKKKSAYLESGELDQRKNLELLAEKLAYEAVLVSRIQEALESSSGSRFFARLIKSEIIETSQLIETLQMKIKGGHTKKVFKNRSSMDYLAKILSRKINILNATRETKSLKKSELIIQSNDVESLKASQKEISMAVEKYKFEKLAELSAALASETLSYVSANDVDFEQQRANIEAARVREAWAAARDALGAELVQAEVARALTRAAQACEGQLLDTRNGRLTLTAQDRADLELWWQAAHDHLRCEMDVAVRDIASRYRECLAEMSRRPSSETTTSQDSRILLQQLADVLAQKALIDARISVVDGTYQASSHLINGNEKSEFSALMQEGGQQQTSEAESVVNSLESDPTQEAEFIYLFQHFSNECRALFSGDCSSNSEDLMKISQSLEQVENQLQQVQIQLSGRDEEPSRDGVPEQEAGEGSQLTSVLERCESLRRRVETLSTLVPCQHCKQLQDALDRLKSERSRGETALQQQAGALAAARRARQQLQAQHERERQQLRERAMRLERRLATLDSEYSQQLENLRAAYRDTLSADRDVQGEGIRARYQAEIEQLRALCEKGLLAMESSHRRIVHEMEEKHKAEREHLRLDKEAALAEETRATLAALDAMRKAHESEVRREVDKFKADYLGQPGAGRHVPLLSTRHHSIYRQEMEEIKQEILSLSEKYSVKCVESAALEERLVSATQQLTQAQQHIMQLDARNKQLRAHLMSEANEMKSSDCTSLSHLIDESPSERGCERGTDAAPLWEHLRHLAAVWQKANPQEGDTDTATPKTEPAEPGTSHGGGTKDKDPICKNRKHKKPAVVPRAELKGRCSVSGRASLSPLVGMVAERKKRFEM